MKLRLNFPKRKIRATAARRASQSEEYEDEEPTMKLSTAFFVVLILHLIAVGGVYAFESMKAHHPASLEDPKAASAKSAKGDATAPDSETSAVATPDGSATAPAVPAASKTIAATTKTAASKPADAAKTADSKPASSTAGPKDSGIIHTVVKGESPVAIAHKLGVSYDDLLKLNHIDDPKKLQIGQKLHVPLKSKPAASKTAED